MPRAAQPTPLVVVCGEDDFAVKERAKEIFRDWSTALGGTDHEMIDGAVSNSGEALRVLSRLREALQTLPFFGNGKAIWLKNCSFLGDERAASAQSVTEALADLAEELKSYKWGTVRLLISAGKVDKRKTFYKALDKLGTVESFAGLSADAKDWVEQAEARASKAFELRGKQVSDAALAELVNRVGPNPRQLESEVEKLALYLGDRPTAEVKDVEAVSISNKTARAFALAEALGDRDLPRLMHRLDEELWEVKLDSQKSEIGLLYGLISKVRTLLMVHQLIREGWVKTGLDYAGFKAQLEQVPASELPEDRRFNPLAQNPYMLYKALPQVKRYSETELIRAMDLLLWCNQQLVSSGADEARLLQQTLVRIVEKPGGGGVR